MGTKSIWKRSRGGTAYQGIASEAKQLTRLFRLYRLVGVPLSVHEKRNAMEEFFEHMRNGDVRATTALVLELLERLDRARVRPTTRPGT